MYWALLPFSIWLMSKPLAARFTDMFEVWREEALLGAFSGRDGYEALTSLELRRSKGLDIASSCFLPPFFADVCEIFFWLEFSYVFSRYWTLFRVHFKGLEKVWAGYWLAPPPPKITDDSSSASWLPTRNEFAFFCGVCFAVCEVICFLRSRNILYWSLSSWISIIR